MTLFNVYTYCVHVMRIYFDGWYAWKAPPHCSNILIFGFGFKFISSVCYKYIIIDIMLYCFRGFFFSSALIQQSILFTDGLFTLHFYMTESEREWQWKIIPVEISISVYCHEHVSLNLFLLHFVHCVQLIGGPFRVTYAHTFI